MPAVGNHLADDQKSDAAKEDQRAGCQVEQNIVLIGDEALPAAEHVKAGVVECCH